MNARYSLRPRYTSFIVRLLIVAGMVAMASAGALLCQTDLEGVWLSNSATPLERPKALEGRATLTPAEVTEFQQRADRLTRDGSNDYLAGDNLFLAALNNVDHYSSPATTDRTGAMVPREFENRTSLITDPPDGKLPPITEAAQRQRGAAAANRHPVAGPEDLNNAERCLTFGTPRLGGNFGAGPYSYYQIVQTPGYVLLFMEAIHEARIIPLDGRPHLPSAIRAWAGDSVGHWDGKTLVVDTTNLPATNSFMGAGPKLHLIERFTRVAENQLNYEVTIDDPDTWARPWTASLPLRRSAERMFEFACHEGNENVMKGMLQAGR
jgi:hypothetical protein